MSRPRCHEHHRLLRCQAPTRTPPAAGSLRRCVLRGIPALRPSRSRPRPHGAGRLDGHPRRRVGVVDVGARGRTLQPRLASARPGRRAGAGDPGGARHAHLRDASLARAEVPRGQGRAPDGGADPLRASPGCVLRPPRLPVPCGPCRGARGHALSRPSNGHRLPGRQRAGDGALSQPLRLPGVRGRHSRALRRRRRGLQPAMGPRVLVASDQPVGRALGPRRQHGAFLRPGMASIPGCPDDRVHRRSRPRSYASWHVPTSSSRPAWR